MALDDYTSEIFHASHSRYNTRMSAYEIDLSFRKSVYCRKTLSYLGTKTSNSLPAQIKLRKNVNTLNMTSRICFSNKLQKRDDSIFIYY